MVISNTTPLNYLIQIGRIDLLAALFGEVIIPFAVQRELTCAAAPLIVRDWFNPKPDWLRVEQVTLPIDVTLRHLHAGESEAITLAELTQANALIIDDLDGREEQCDAA